MSIRIVKTILNDATDDTQDNVDVDVIIEADRILIQVKGYGDGCSKDGEGIPILIERNGGELRAVCWTDINEQDPQIVSLEGAKEDKRNAS